jgi:hypothetical protein
MSHSTLWIATCFFLGVGFSVVALCVGVQGWDYFALLAAFVLGCAISGVVGVPGWDDDE